MPAQPAITERLFDPMHLADLMPGRAEFGERGAVATIQFTGRPRPKTNKG